MGNVNLPCDEETGEADQPADNEESSNGKDTWDEVLRTTALTSKLFRR